MPTSSQLPILSRRGFLSGCAGAAACSVCPALCAKTPVPAKSLLPDVRTKVRIVYTYPPPDKEGWPYVGYDYETRMNKIEAELRKLCPNVDFLPVSAPDEPAAKKVLESGAEVDGYIAYILGIPSSGARTIALSGSPTIVADDLYGGTGSFLGVYSDAVRRGARVVGVSSSRMSDLADAVRALETVKKLSVSTLLDVVDRDLGEGGKLYKDTLGVTIRGIRAEELHSAYEAADPAEAARWAQTWIKGAQKVIEPSREELGKSGAMYVGMMGLLERNKAQGIAVDCLRLFYGRKMFAYPCMGFFQMNNDGLVGACEADLQSATTMLLLGYLTGRPGYISDPVIDTSKNQIIYAHCVAANKVYGPAGTVNPYHIRDHSEDHKGAAVRSLMPIGEMTTSLKFIPQSKVVVMHTAKTVANIGEDRACRTKLAAEVKDAHRMAAEWSYGWHRVTVYGDARLTVKQTAALLGFQVVEEG